MPFGDATTLQAHFNNDNFITEIEEARFTEITSQVSDLIYQKTKITAQDTVADNPGILRYIWANIVAFEIMPYQKGITDEEKTRRTTKFKNAMSLLDQIETGDLEVMDAEGNVLGDSAEDTVSEVKSNIGKRINLIP